MTTDIKTGFPKETDRKTTSGEKVSERMVESDLLTA